MKLGGICFKVIAVVLILTFIFTQNLAYASDALTATVAAANSASVREQISNELGMDPGAPGISEHSVPMTVRRIDSFKSELRSSENSGHSLRLVANGHIKRYSPVAMALAGFYFLPLAFDSFFAVPRADVADWCLFIGYAVGASSFFSVSMELVANWSQTRSSFVINSFEHKYVKGNRVRLTDLNVSDLQLFLSVVLILIGSFLRHSGIVWLHLIQAIAIVAFFTSSVFSTPERNVAKRIHVKDTVRANSTLIAQLTIPVLSIFLAVFSAFLGILNQAPGVYYLLPFFIAASVADAWSKWYVSVYVPFVGSVPISGGVIKGDELHGRLDTELSNHVYSQIVELMDRDPEVQDAIERMAQAHDLSRFVFDERQMAQPISDGPLTLSFAISKNSKGEFEARYGLPRGGAILLIRITSQEPSKRLELKEVKSIVLRDLNYLSSRSELRMPGDHYAVLGMIAVGVAAWVFRLSRLKKERKLAVGQMTERIMVRIRKNGIDPNIELKWLDLKRVALSLARENNQEIFSKKLDLLVSLILKINQLLKPNRGSAGHALAIEMNRGIRYDIDALFQEAWAVSVQGKAVDVELTSVWSRDLVLYRPQLKRSELRNEIIDEFASGIIDRFINAPVEIIGAKIRMSSGTVETQLRRRDVYGKPINLGVAEIPRNMYELFPIELGDENLFAIDIIPSEDFPEGVIKPEFADEYKRRFSDILHDLLSADGIARLDNLAADRTRQPSFWVDEDQRFEVVVGHFPRNPGVYINIYIHPEMQFVPRNKHGVAREMLSRFVKRDDLQAAPASVDLVMQGARNGDFIISNHQWMSDENVIERGHRNRKLLDPEPAATLVVPAINTGDQLNGKSLRLTFVSLFPPPSSLELSDDNLDELEREIVSILETLSLLRYELSEGQILRNYFQTPHFSVRIGRSSRNGGTYFSNIYFIPPTDPGEDVIISADADLWKPLKSDMALASSLLSALQFQAARIFLARILDFYASHQNQLFILSQMEEIFDQFAFYASDIATHGNGDVPMAEIAERFALILKDMIVKQEIFKNDTARKEEAVGVISQGAALFIRLNDVKRARALLSAAKLIFQSLAEGGDFSVKFKIRARRLFIHYLHMTGMYLDGMNHPALGLDNIRDARAMFENAIYFLKWVDVGMIDLASVKDSKESLGKAIRDANKLLAALERHPKEIHKKRVVSDGLNELIKLRGELNALKQPRSELRLVQAVDLMTPALELESLISGSVELKKALIVSRALAFEKGTLPVFAAMANQGIPVAIVAPSVELDQRLILEMNQILNPEHQIVMGRDLREAAELLRRRTERPLVFVKGESEGLVDSERHFASRYSGEIVELGNYAIDELRMSVRGLAELMNKVAAVYQQIYQSA